jgi:hypothetical protein
MDGSFSVTMPAGVQVHVYGNLALNSTASVTVDGVAVDADVKPVEGRNFRWLSTVVLGEPGPRNVSVAVRGSARVSSIGAWRPGRSYSCGLHSYELQGLTTTDCYKLTFHNWTSGLDAQRSGAWAMSVSARGQADASGGRRCG